MFLQRFGVALVALALTLPAVNAGSIKDVLDTPAGTSPLAEKSLLNGLAIAGKRIVAVGQRGHIVYSDDRGERWAQASVPVSSDLVAVSFPTPRKGWAVGHDGVVLHSADGGKTWTKQLDGRSAGRLLLDGLAARAEKGALGSQDESQKLLNEARRIAAQGPESPFLDVWFADEHNGFIVGAFNLIFSTNDGGHTWAPWFDRTENPERLHLYAIRGIGSDVYVTGEQGLVLKLDREAGRFRVIATPYKGTFLGVAGVKESVVVFGLRGNAFRSTDGGANWQQIETGVQDGLTAGAHGPHGFVLVSQSGNVLLSNDGGEHFALQRQDSPVPASAVVSLDNSIVIAGARGVHAQAFNQGAR